MNREELPRIRLKVATNAGINILCTALRTWRVVEWLPHIQEAYREVKEDQEGDEDSRKRFIRAIRIKKGNFYIANSQLIGDIFEDNDEVQCEIAFPTPEKKKSKKERKESKKSRKEVERAEKAQSAEEEGKQKEKESVEEVEEEQQHEEKPKKRIKTASADEPKQVVQKNKPSKASKKQAKPQKSPSNSLSKKQQQSLQKSQKSTKMKQNLIKNIDFSKLKSLINEGNSSVKEQESVSSPSS